MNNYIIERIKYYKNCDYGKIVLVQHLTLAKTMQGNNIARVFCHDRCDLEYEKIKDALKRSNKNE